MTTQVPRAGLGDDAREQLLVFRIYDPSNRDETLLLSLPWDGTILYANWTMDAGSFDFSLDIEGTDVSWTTAAGTTLGASTTPTQDTGASDNTFSAGDTMTIEIGTVTGTPNYLLLEVFVRLDEEDA